MTYQLSFTFNLICLPNEGLVVFGFGDLWKSILVYGREDVERGNNTRNGETQHPEC